MKINLQSVLFIILSVLIPVAAVVLAYGLGNDDQGAHSWVMGLPAVNALVNTATVVALLMGYVFIKNGKQDLHKKAMIAAFILGTFFLVFYIIYHAQVPPTRYGGEGALQKIYYFVLISHILLAFIVVPLVLLAFYFALSGKFEKHKRIVRYTLPVWLYVSVTGVLVYLMISPYYSN